MMLPTPCLPLPLPGEATPIPLGEYALDPHSSDDYTGSSPFAQGITSDDYRAQIRQHGERVRWWRAMETPGVDSQSVGLPSFDRVEHVEQTHALDGTLLEAEKRVLISRGGQNLLDTQLGRDTMNEATVVCVPDEMLLVSGDHLAIMLDSGLPAQAEVQRGAGDLDVLARWPVVGIVDVRDSTRVYALDADYAVADEGVRWLPSGRKPDEGAPYYVEWRHLPRYYVTGEFKGMITGADDKRLPQIAQVRLVQD